jgi:ADP-dependent NAD(P)H-hydrate dehydratase / NAD(P)H-hydrate epimerase
MKVLLSPQIREADAYTIKNKPISSIDLMEEASRAFYDWYLQNIDHKKKIIVFAGPGNNGGDGLAIARMMVYTNLNVQVYVVCKTPKGSNDFLANLEKIKPLLQVNAISSPDQIPEIDPSDVVVDAIFGSGLDRKAEDIFAEAIKKINNANCTVVAVDIASGLFSDKKTDGDTVVKATYTISFQVPKLAFFMRENHPYVGEWHVVDIGLDEQFLKTVPSKYHTIDKALALKALPKRDKYSHKGNFGRTIVFAGSRGKLGAAILCNRACLRTGVGLLTAHVPEYGYQIMQMAVPEAMVSLDPSIGCFSEVPDMNMYDCVGIGPGMGTNGKTLPAFKQLLQQTKFPIVMDADAINLLGMEKNLIEMIPENSILTPHPKEFERLAGETNNDFERLDRQIEFAVTHKVYLIVKGAHSSVATPHGEVYFNMTGNPGMATAGSGDVLTGMVTALLAQSKDPFYAAVGSVYLHGLAGDLAAKRVGEEALIASDIIDHIPEAIKELKGNGEDKGIRV